MTRSVAATVGNGLVLARIGRDGSIAGLSAPSLDSELVEKRIHSVIKGHDGERRISGSSWKHHLEYVRGTNVLRVISNHASGIKVERRIAAIGDSLRTAFRSDEATEMCWERGVEAFLPEEAERFDKTWPDGFDPPPLGGATRSSVVARVPDLKDRAAITDLYGRSILVIAQHHDRKGSFAAGPDEDVVLAHALDMCGERGAALAFFEWAVANNRGDPRVAPMLRPPQPAAGVAATLWTAWQQATDGRRAESLHALHAAVAKRSPLGLFLSANHVDLLAHAYLLLTVQALIPSVTGDEDGFFEHQSVAQKTRHVRALYGGVFHAGMPEPGQDLLIAQVRADLDVKGLTIEVDGESVEQLTETGRPNLWTAPLPPATPGEVSRYRIRAHLSDAYATPVWASDSDPRPGGQEFAFEDAPPPAPDWIRDAIFYHVMVDRFARPGADLPEPGDPTALCGGTLDGIREHLDHITSLGSNVLWLSPVHLSPSHHGYDHEDFLKVEPRYGGEPALIRLVKAAHEKGMRVLLDFVPNHTGRGHHLFRDAIAKGGDAASYYRFWQWPHYYRCFGDVITLPELDTGNSRVQQQLVRAAQHWLTGYGVDGVRCDHVAGVDPAFWVELRRGLREVKPDALILGEATGVTEWLARYAGRIDAIFDFDLAYYVRQALARGRMDATSFASWLDHHEKAYPGLVMATLLDNHDMNRFLWMAGGNVERLKLAATLLMTMPGTPIIYYGTEVGLSQRYDGVMENAEARLPMLWGADQNPELLAHFQELGRMRGESVALRRGDRKNLLADKEVLVYERTAGDDTVTVALNFSEQPQRRDVAGQTIELEPLDSVVIREPSTIST